jgi:hypothetical protein
MNSKQNKNNSFIILYHSSYLVSDFSILLSWADIFFFILRDLEELSLSFTLFTALFIWLTN